MKYASIDTETLGLDPRTCDLIEVGIVLEDTADPQPVEQLPTFHCYVLPHAPGIYQGQPFAMSMHPTILRRIATREPGYIYLQPEEVADAVADFLSIHGFEYGQTSDHAKLTCAGKNFASFDREFLANRLPRWEDTISIAHRSLDPGSMFADPHDSRVPDTKECLRRACIVPDPEQQHSAVYDAQMVITLIRKHWGLWFDSPLSFKPVMSA